MLVVLSHLTLLHVCVFQHQQQVLGAIERAKQVTPPEMNSIIRVGCSLQPLLCGVTATLSLFHYLSLFYDASAVLGFPLALSSVLGIEDDDKRSLCVYYTECTKH